MDNFDALDRAAAGFAETLERVGADQWSLDTPNEGRSVRQLVDHVVGGDRMALAILAGGTKEDGLAQFARSADDTDLVAAFAESRRQLAEAFAEPGALERTVAHPSMTMPGAQLLGFRISEYALHGWDLAQAIGAGSELDPDVAQAVWAVMSPMADFLPATGMFGAGASGSLPDDATIQHRVLDLSGRRPTS
jgi:uncharacterized protein (TIGR03086 family)